MTENNSNLPKRRRGKGRPFQKGVSGNPGGRPKAVREVAAAAQFYTQEALETLARVMGDETAPANARVNAANAILDRGWGKPPQALYHGGSLDFGQLSDAELNQQLESALGAAGLELVPATPGNVHALEAPKRLAG